MNFSNKLKLCAPKPARTQSPKPLYDMSPKTPHKNEHLNFETKEELKSLVKKKFSKPLDSLKSFEELSEITKLSVQTLRRIFGKIESEKKTFTSSLSLLCNYVGYQDWETFLKSYANAKNIHVDDKVLIDSMSVFFKNGEKYNTDYFQKTSIVDTLNDYAKIIYASRENLEYFYKIYKENNWATDYILAWIPNYNLFAQDWFREILEDKIQRTKISHVKLSQTNFICFGAFLSENKSEFDKHFRNLKTLYKKSREEFGYLPYHEMRYTTVCLMNDLDDSEKIISEYLHELRNQNYSQENFQEILIFFANTLVWLQKNSSAYDILQEAKTYLTRFQKRKDKSFLHYYGMNMAFVKTTFSLVYIANSDKNISDFKITSSDFSDYADLLYHDYANIMYFAKCILSANNFEQKENLFAYLNILVSKTNYTKIFKILENLDSYYSHYFVNPFSANLD